MIVDTSASLPSITGRKTGFSMARALETLDDLASEASLEVFLELSCVFQLHTSTWERKALIMGQTSFLVVFRIPFLSMYGSTA